MKMYIVTAKSARSGKIGEIKVTGWNEQDVREYFEQEFSATIIISIREA